MKHQIPGKLKLRKTAVAAVAAAAVLVIASALAVHYVRQKKAAALEQQRLVLEQEERERKLQEEKAVREKAKKEAEQLAAQLSPKEKLLRKLLQNIPESSAKSAGIRLTSEEDARPEESVIISFYAAPYPSNSGSKYNAKKAAQLLNGAVVPSGKSFSYNDRIGERTKENGFVEAPVINGGRMEMGLGGGICEISSLLYNLCLQSGFTVLERSPHSLLVPYVPGGLDAAVSWGTMDFRFRNSYTVPVVLLAGYDEEEQIFMVAAAAKDGGRLLNGLRYVPVSEQTGELRYRASLQIWQDTMLIGQEDLGESTYLGVDDYE